MQLKVKPGRLDEAPRDAVGVFGAFEGNDRPSAWLPASGRDRLDALVRGSGFRGAPNEHLLLPDGRRWMLVVGLGKVKDFSLERVRQFAGTAAKAVRSSGNGALTLPVIEHDAAGSVETVAQALVEGTLLGLYRYDRLKEVPPHEGKRRLTRVMLKVERSSSEKAAKRGADRGRIIAESVAVTRDLINAPSNFVTPTALADHARALAKKHRLGCTVMPFARLKRLGFGGIAGVAQGSAHPAQFIVLDYRPARVKATLALCGKGITFDTGGINLKTSGKMELMKYDMSGAAAVLGTLQAVAQLKLPYRVVGIIAATENMPSGTAQKPGDVLKTLSGKTVEVMNTDAEGRLVLSDCLHYAKRYKPDCVVDIATLTGACMVALGSFAIGLASNDDLVAGKIESSGQRTHERVWRLPLWNEYGELMKSDIADLRNISATGEAGTITASKFLEAFVGDMRWAHLDIASTAWAERERPYVPKGAVGIGVRLLVDFIEQWR